MSTESTATQPQKVVVEIATPKAGEPATPTAADFQRMTPEQFKARLEEEAEAGARRLLKQFGVKKDDRVDVLNQIRNGKYMLAPTPAEGEPDYKAEYEKLSPIAKEFEATKAELAAAHETLKGQFNAAFEKLPDEVQKYIVETTPDDWRARQKALVAMEKSGMLAKLTGSATATVAVGGEVKTVKPATTMGAQGPKVTPTGESSPQQQYDAHIAGGRPHAAAAIAAQHRGKIDTRPPSKRK